MQISASMVKELRERTGAGMMECKKALVDAEGDMDGAAENLRKAGVANADKKAGRIAAEGAVVIQSSDDDMRIAVVEVNSETDFVAKDENFRAFSEQVAQAILAGNPASNDDLAELRLDGESNVEQGRRALVAKVGENIQVRRFETHDSSGGAIGRYLHGSRIAVVTEVVGGNELLARDIAMHVAASRPMCVSAEQVPADVLDKEREILAAQAADSGKPPEIVAKMVEGRIKKYLAEITLHGQPFVKDMDKTVGQLLNEASAEVAYFVRYEVGEGIEKRQENFADEVISQAKGG